MTRGKLAGALDQLEAYLRYQKLLGVAGLALSRDGWEAFRNLDRSPPNPGLAEPAPIPESTGEVAREGAQPAGEAAPPKPDLAGLARKAETCTGCALCRTRTKVVFGEGDPRAELMFIGEGPGRDEDLSGKPFVGRAGQLLTKIIKAMGLERDQIYITNVVKCRPPNNRDPKPEESAACREWLNSQLDLIRPRVIVALGKVAAHNLLETEEPISRLRGSFRQFNGIPLMPTFHPSYLLRQANPRGPKKMVWEDMKNVLAKMGREVPRP